MDETAEILKRLDRIDALTREGAEPGDVLAEVRGLLAEGERASMPADAAGRAPDERPPGGGAAHSIGADAAGFVVRADAEQGRGG